MKIVVLNGAKVNYDGIIDYSVLANEGDELVVCDMCKDHGYTEISEGAEVIISKELPMSREDIMALPDTVKLICEAGTGYNNIDLDACRERGIGVCNVPSYSSERVAHTAVMMMLMLASTMQTQISMLAKGDHREGLTVLPKGLAPEVCAGEEAFFIPPVFIKGPKAFVQTCGPDGSIIEPPFHKAHGLGIVVLPDQIHIVRTPFVVIGISYILSQKQGRNNNRDSVFPLSLYFILLPGLPAPSPSGASYPAWRKDPAFHTCPGGGRGSS
jgi:hypothetical protein